MCLQCFCPLGDGMNAYVAYKVSTRVCSKAFVHTFSLCVICLQFCVLSVHRLYFQTSLPMFRSKAFTVRRRYSDFLGLYEKLSVKQSLHGCIIPPPPEKSVVGGWPSGSLFFSKSVSLSHCVFVSVFVTCHVSFGPTGMTKVKVGMDDPSSVEFVERRRAALERQGSIHVSDSDTINKMRSNIYVGPACLIQTHTDLTIHTVARRTSGLGPYVWPHYSQKSCNK